LKRKTETESTLQGKPPNSLAKDMVALYEEAATSGDVTFVVQGKRIGAHRLILSARSPVFDRMFNPGGNNNGIAWKEATEEEVEIQAADSATFAEMLAFIYCGTLSDDVAINKFALLVLADRYEVLSLKNVCELSLIDHLNRHNVVKLLIYTDQIHCSKLKAACIAVIVADTAGAMTSKYWKQLLDYPELLNQILAKKCFPSN
jgi:speckle-type POZ protein